MADMQGAVLCRAAHREAKGWLVAEFILGNSLRRLARENHLLQRILWRLDHALVWTLVKLFEVLPVDAASNFGYRVGRWIGPRLKRKTAIFRANMATAFPDIPAQEIEEMVDEAWGRAGRVLAEYPHLATIFNDPDRLLIETLEQIETYRNPARPCIFVGAHLSNWEIMASAIARMDIPVAVLYSPPTNPYLDRMLRSSRLALNCEVLPRDNSTRSLMRALKEGRSIGMVMDRRVDEGSPIAFFGQDKPSTLVPARLALKFSCDLVPVRVLPLGPARYRVIFNPPVRPSDPGADPADQAVDMVAQVHALFEEWIRENPQDWFCSKRLWASSKIGPSGPQDE